MLPPMSHLIRRLSRVQLGTVMRATLAVLLACGVALAVSYASARQRSARATARLNSAAARLDSLTDAAPADDRRRVAIAWGYAERMRLGLESPFRLIEAADRDPRLTADERRTVAWALLAHVLRGETHDVDPASLDELGPVESGRIASGDQHLALIREAIVGAEDPRAAELAIRLAYTLASAERLVDGSAPFLVAEAAAMIADGEIARREAAALLRSSRGEDLIAMVRGRRARKAFYVERPTLLAPGEDVERAAIVMARPLLDTIRVMRPVVATDSAPIPDLDVAAAALAPRLYAAGVRVPPSAPLAVTVQRYVPTLRFHAPRNDKDAHARARNAEMLVAVTRVRDAGRQQRRVIGRLLLAAGVAMRSLAQEPVWFATDTVPSTTELATSLGLRGIVFDHDVPRAWRPYYLRSLADGVRDLRRVLPALRLDAVQVRFRMTAPVDSALAMHDPRTRTLHLPILSAGGTLSHELAHDLDRQSAIQEGYAGYRSDIVARSSAPQSVVGSANGRLAASLLALTEELSAAPQASRAVAERPAEIFATRVDWFVASALARQGISSGFLSAVQDELLTGHVVHPERLRTSSRTRSLLTALEGMTTVAPFAAQDQEPSVQTLLRWSLAGPVDRRGAAEILRHEQRAWALAPLTAGRSCDEGGGISGRVALVRMAAESRARGWMRLRARWTADAERGAWARATLRQAPWSEAEAEQRVAALRDYVLVGLATSEVLPAGLSAYAAPLAMRARCTSQERRVRGY
jgi:hypothetical protein